MRKEIYIVIISALIVLSLAFLFSRDFSLTGNVIYSDVNESNQSFVEPINVTREMALEAINNSEIVINRMAENNFSIIYMNDTLIEANRAFQRAEYAEILRGNVNATRIQMAEARVSMALVDLSKTSYTDVINYTDKIIGREKQAFEIYDSITFLNKSIQKYSLQGINVSEAEGFWELASKSFYEDRYSEAENFILLSRESLDKIGSETSILVDLRRWLIGFIQRYWAIITLGLIVLSLIWKISYRRVKLKILKNRIIRIKTEEKVLVNLMKVAQEERFKENKISGLTYNVRMRKYKEKLENLKQELPVLEERLKEQRIENSILILLERFILSLAILE